MMARPRYAVAAAVLVAVFLLLHALGLREEVAILSGTRPASATAAAGGLLYVAAWLACVVAAPILAIAAALRALSSRLLPKSSSQDPAGRVPSDVRGVP